MSAATTDPHPDATEVLSHIRCARCGRRWLAEGDWSQGYPLACPHCGEGRPGVLGVHREP